MRTGVNTLLRGKKGIQGVGRKEYLGKSPWKFYILITLSGEKKMVQTALKSVGIKFMVHRKTVIKTKKCIFRLVVTKGQ